LNKDPDNVQFQRAWRGLQRLDKLKKEGTDAFQTGHFKEAVERFSEALELDPLNAGYNQTILYNRACAYAKQNMTEESLKDLDAALVLNDEYVKALLKRSELHLLSKNFDSAVRDLERIKQLEPQTPGLRQRLQEA
jgi:DnaJ family protein C protein 7